MPPESSTTKSWSTIERQADCALPHDPGERDDLRKAVFRMVQRLGKDHLYLPPWIILRLLSAGWDLGAKLLNAGSPENPWFHQWTQIVNDCAHHRRESPQDRAFGLTLVLARRIASFAIVSGLKGLPASVEAAALIRGEHASEALHELDKNIEKLIRGASRTSLTEKLQPRTLIGLTWTAPGSFVPRLGPPDPCVVPILGRFSESRARANDAFPGEQAGEKAPRKRRAHASDFYENAQGRLPDNLSNLSPVELMYLADEKDHFHQRVVENALWQRFGSRPTPDEIRPRVLVDLDLAESEDMHKWESGEEYPPVSLARAALCAIHHRLHQLSDILSMDCEIRTRRWAVEAKPDNCSGMIDDSNHRPESPFSSYATLRRHMPEAFVLYGEESQKPLPTQDVGRPIDFHLRILMLAASEERLFPDKWPSNPQTNSNFGLKLEFHGQEVAISSGRIAKLQEVHGGKPKRQGPRDMLDDILKTLAMPFQQSYEVANENNEDLEFI